MPVFNDQALFWCWAQLDQRLCTAWQKAIIIVWCAFFIEPISCCKPRLVPTLWIAEDMSYVLRSISLKNVFQGVGSTSNLMVERGLLACLSIFHFHVNTLAFPWERLEIYINIWLTYYLSVNQKLLYAWLADYSKYPRIRAGGISIWLALKLHVAPPPTNYSNCCYFCQLRRLGGGLLAVFAQNTEDNYMDGVWMSQ